MKKPKVVIIGNHCNPDEIESIHQALSGIDVPCVLINTPNTLANTLPKPQPGLSEEIKKIEKGMDEFNFNPPETRAERRANERKKRK